MLALKGYFNGKEFVPLDKASIKPNQKVIITVLDEYINEDETILSEETKTKLDAIDKLNGLLKTENNNILEEFDLIVSQRLNFGREVTDV